MVCKDLHIDSDLASLKSVTRLLNLSAWQGILKINNECSRMAISTRGIKLSELATMPEDEKNRRLGELVQAVVNPTALELAAQRNDITEKIQQLEFRYKMSSDEMKRQLREGKIRETADFCHWLMLLRIRGRFESENRPPQS